MRRMIIFGLACIVALGGCQTLFDGGETYERGTVEVESTQYEIYERVRSTNPNFGDSTRDPNATRAFYARVGPGSTVYCGPSRAGCEAAILRFNNNQQPSEEMY